MKNTILKQKAERDKLLGMEYLERVANGMASSYLPSKLIKLITGPRRAGKSSLAVQMLKGKKFAYLNFDDNTLLNGFSENIVEDLLDEIYPNYEYLLLDEVQNLRGWSLWVEKLYRRGVNLIITGSNANLLSDDIAAVLSGRFLEIRIYPFSASEYREHVTGTGNESLTDYAVYERYLNYGGYPEVALTPQVTQGYLSSLYDSTIVKDIVRRYNIRKVDELYSIANWLLANFTNAFSASSLAGELDMKSVTTVQKYCRFLSNTYLFQFLPRFNSKFKLMNKADRKCYVIDTGFISARAFELSANRGRLLENMIFTELLKRGYDLKKNELFYYRSRNEKEVDFVYRKGITAQGLIQVCYDISGKGTRKREISSLIECADELRNKNLQIVTWNQDEIIEQDGYTIKVISIGNWLSKDM